ncbi:MAG: hypothetical protein ACI4V7_00370 [Succinivibrionaceae bacterium]
MNTESWYKKEESTNNFGITLVIYSFKLFGWFGANIILFFITLFIWLFNSKVKKISHDYFFYLSLYAKSKGINNLEGNTFFHIFCFCKSLLEKFLAWKGLITIDSVDSIDNAHKRMLEVASKPKGVLVFGAHIGNIEMLRALNQTVINKVLNIIILTSNSKKFLKYLNELNPNSNLNFIIAEDMNPGTMIDISEKVNKGEWIIVLADRVLNEKSRYVEVDFLTKKAKLPQGPWIMAQLLHVPVYTLYNIKINGKNTIYFNELGDVVLSRKNREEDIKKYAQIFADEMADILLKSPTSWFNFYDYWN